MRRHDAVTRSGESHGLRVDLRGEDAGVNVVRIADSLRRPAMPWSPGVQAAPRCRVKGAYGVWENGLMGTSGDKPRKPKRRLAKVKYAEANNIQLAGLAENSNTPSGTRLGHATAHGRSQNIGAFGRFVLWCLGRRPKEIEPEGTEEPEQD